MGIKRIVDVQFWTDDKVVEMFSPEDKLFMLYLLTNPHTTQLGIYAINKKIMAFELGYSVEAISVLMDRFEIKYNLIKYSTESKEVAVKNYLRHSIVKGGAPVRDCLVKELKQVKDRSLIEFVFSYLKNFDNLNDTVKKVIAEYYEKNGSLSFTNEKQNDNDNDNENENENEVSYHESLTIRSRTGEEIEKKQLKVIGGEIGQGVVKLTDEQFEDLLDRLGMEGFNDYVKRLADYILNNKAEIRSHYKTILKWYKEDQGENL